MIDLFSYHRLITLMEKISLKKRRVKTEEIIIFRLFSNRNTIDSSIIVYKNQISASQYLDSGYYSYFVYFKNCPKIFS